MTRFSVIIPTYNRAPFLNRAINSVGKQDCVAAQDIEILLIDDGSTDGTEKVVRKLQKELPLLKYIEIDHVGEPGTVRNHGLRQAIGDFIAYCDSDDYWLPHHLATASQAFKRYSDIGMVSNYWALAQFTLAPSGVITKIVVPPNPPSSVNTNCRVHRRECVEHAGYFNSRRWGEDQDFFGKIENLYQTYKTGIVTSINGYTKGGNNLSYQFDRSVRSKYYR